MKTVETGFAALAVILLLGGHLAEGFFSRKCVESECKFMPAENVGLKLKCEEERCDCKLQGVMDVGYGGRELLVNDGKCLIGANGPCGIHDGVQIDCEEGLKCIENRCKTSKKIEPRWLSRTNKAGFRLRWEVCSKDNDCVSPLTCAYTGRNKVGSRYCDKFRKRPEMTYGVYPDYGM